MSDENTSPLAFPQFPSAPESAPDTSQDFLFDDFFATADDPGVVVPVTIKGRVVPITLRRGLSVADRARAQSKAVKKHLDPTGRVIFDGLDEEVLQEELLLSAILSWPFKNRDGSLVPVTRENISKLLGGSEEIATAINTIDAQGEKALAPFVTPSPAV